MTRRKTVTLDKVTLRVPPGTDPQAVLKAVTEAVRGGAVSDAPALRIDLPALRGEGPQALAQRIGRATAVKLRNGGGS